MFKEPTVRMQIFLLNPIVLLWVKYIILSVKIALSNKNLEKGPRQCYHKVGSNLVHTFLVRFNIYIFSYYSIFSFASFSLEMLREILKKNRGRATKDFNELGKSYLERNFWIVTDKTGITLQIIAIKLNKSGQHPTRKKKCIYFPKTLQSCMIFAIATL